jgi:predicted RNA-binding Zn-ribbon protein involved in translation (DUF1610 family)
MTSEVIDGVVREIRDDEEPDRRLTVVGERQQSVQIGLGSVMALSDEQFEANLILLKKGVERAKRLQQALLEEGIDYGTEPGISRPFLHKPGAEKFEKAYGFAIEYAVERKIGDGDKTPELEYIVHAKVHLGDTDGPVIAEGLGSCNTHESKYRYRQAKPVCPDCGKATIIKGKADGKLKGKYWCATRDGGCGHTFEPDSDKGRALAEQPTGQVENENPYDLANTILKMARKRAGVDAILTATGTSGLFSQDADSPSVQQEARRPAATAASGGEAVGQSAQLRGPNTATRLPAPPADITEQHSFGLGDVVGKLGLKDRAPSDGLLRQTPDGMALGFVLDMPSGQKITQVEVRGPLADQLVEAAGGDLKALVGVEVNLEGELFAVPWQKQGEAMPPFYRFRTTAARSMTWAVPPKATAEPKPKRLTKAQQKAADEAAAAERANDDTGEDETANVSAPPPAGPGMSMADFTAGLDTHRIAAPYALAAARQHFPGSESIEALSDEQRLVVATGLGLLEAP